MTEADYEPGTGIVINVSDVVVTIRGRKLDELYSYLLSNRLQYVQEDFSGQDTGENKVFVEAIEIKKRYPQEAIS